MVSAPRIVTKIGLALTACLVILACGSDPAVIETSTSAPRTSITTAAPVATSVSTTPTSTSTSTSTSSGSTDTSTTSAEPAVLTVEVVITELENPRGVGIDAEGALLIAEAGYGEDAEDLILRTGRLTRFRDLDGDGDFHDPGEAERWLDNLFSFNSVNKYQTGRDEVSGATDVLVHDDGRVFLSLDGGIDETGGTFILFEMDEQGKSPSGNTAELQHDRDRIRSRTRAKCTQPRAPSIR